MKSGTVSIVGRPNSGKSTLVNAQVGQKISIVSDKPQTTRHRILGVRTEERGQIAFVDTPGVHKPAYAMNRRMLRAVHAAVRDIDLVLLVVDASVRFGAGESFTLEMVRGCGARALALLNKIDRVRKPQLLPTIERYSKAHEFLEIVPISALTGENLDRLLELVFKHLPEAEARFAADLVTDRTERFLAAELIREKVLARTREELPYATAVVLSKFDESARISRRKLVRIEADIIVEKNSQAAIIVGAGGLVLRDVGTAARLEIEELLDCRVYLRLRVRAVEKWRNSEVVLDELDIG